MSERGENHDFRAGFKSILERSLSPEDAERCLKRVAMRLGGATHEEALAVHPRIEPRRDRDGRVR